MKAIHVCWFVGWTLFFAMFVGYKFLRKMKAFLIAFLVSLSMAIYGCWIFNEAYLQQPKGSAAAQLFVPLVFLVVFKVLRNLFIKLFGNEPLMTGYAQSSWDQGEYRTLHYGDAIFTVLCLLVPVAITILIS